MVPQQRRLPVLALLSAAALVLLPVHARGEGGGGGTSPVYPASFPPRPSRFSGASRWKASTKAAAAQRTVVTIQEEEAELTSIYCLRAGATKEDPALQTAVLGAVVMALLEYGVKMGLQSKGISFPAPLAACLLLLGLLLALERVNGGQWARSLSDFLSPGAALLGRWLPVFFVPGLAMLPLAPSVGGPAEVAKVIAVALVGFVYTLFTTAAAVLAIRKAQGSLASAANGLPKGRKQAQPTGKSAPASPPFTGSTLTLLLRTSAALGGASLLLSLTEAANGGWSNALRTSFFAASTIAAYVWGARLPAGFTSVVHPLVVSSVLILGVAALWGHLTSQSFQTVLRSYKVGSLQWDRAGAGDVLLYLLGPSVVSFALGMYGRRQLLGENLVVVALAMLVSSLGGLYGTAAMVRLISLGGAEANGRVVRLSVLARNVTTALAIALTNMLGGDISICASVVVLTGIVGATYGKALLTRAGISDPVARGLAVGSSSQGLGVASMSDEPDAFPFAAISMVLTAIAATTMVSIPAVKSSIIQIASGSSA